MKVFWGLWVTSAVKTLARTGSEPAASVGLSQNPQTAPASVRGFVTQQPWEAAWPRWQGRWHRCQRGASCVAQSGVCRGAALV